MAEFRQKQTTRKGDIGELAATEGTVSSGWIVYEPSSVCSDRPHPFDRIAIHPATFEIFIFEIKTKPARSRYPDTGIDLAHYKIYKQTQAETGLDVCLLFVDQDMGKIYGGTLKNLEREINSYPRIESGIIYFPLKNMKTFCRIKPEYLSEIKRLSSRSEKYDEEANQDLFGWAVGLD